ncbi:MAG: helix-turn-helix domain-containing protein [Bacteriovorax sp.]
MKTFKNIADLVKSRRTNHSKKYTQKELATLMGHHYPELIANIENANCSVPLKKMSKLCSILKIHPEELKVAIMKDHEESLNRFFSKTFVKKPLDM